MVVVEMSAGWLMERESSRLGMCCCGKARSSDRVRCDLARLLSDEG